MSELTLYGYRYSVYTRVVRIVLHLKSAVYEFHDLNPFEKDITDLHPFGKVPVLDHRKNKLFETNEITRYLDRAISGLRSNQMNHMNWPCKTRSFQSLITMPTNPWYDLSLRIAFFDRSKG